MFEVLNIKFDRQSKPGEVVTAIGDAHLAKLEEVESSDLFTVSLLPGM